MSLIYRFHPLLLFSLVSIQLDGTSSAKPPQVNISEMMIKARIVPDVIPIPPKELLEVRYYWGVVAPGKRYTHMETILPPKVKWKAEPYKLYTLYMSCITKYIVQFLPQKKETYNFTHGGYEYQNWVVINIPDGDVQFGKTLFEYFPPGSPGDDAVVDRFTFLVFPQTYKIDDYPPPRRDDRYDFGEIPVTQRFTEKYHLGKPVAGNYFLTHW